MPKFGKKFKQLQIKEFEKEYINYKSLKHFIKEKKNLNSLEDIKDEVITSFKNELDKELKKFYLFFVNQERKLYLQINNRLYYRNSYSNLDLEGIIKEYNEIISIEYSSLYFASYVNLNIKAIFKILKKFDHKLSTLNSNLKNEYIIEKFSLKNSDLLYIFQYKMIDEVNAVIENLKEDLEKYYNSINEGNKKLKDINSDFNNSLINDYLIINDEFTKKKDNFNEKKKNFNLILEQNEFLYQNTQNYFKIWNRIFEIYEYKQESTLMKKTLHFNKETLKTIVNKINIMISESNERNIFITLNQNFLMNSCYSYIFPNIIDLMKEKKINNYILILAMTPIGNLLSMIFFKFLIYKTYKFTMLISGLFSLIGNLIIIFYNNNIYLLCLSRFIFGCGMNSSINRKYLLYFIPKKKIQIYLIYFKVLSILGLIFGFFLSFIFSSFIKNEYFIKLPTFILFFFTFVNFILIIFFYSDPVNKKFNLYKEGKNPLNAFSKGEIISIDDYMTNYESEKINELNEQLNIINNEIKFNDTNLLSNFIEDIIFFEIEIKHHLKKTFFAILFFIFVNRFKIYLFISLTPFFTNLFVPFNHIMVNSLLFFFTYFIFIFCFILNLFYISVKIEKIQYILFLGLTFLICDIIILLIYFFGKNAFPFYCFFFIISINISLISEDELFYFFSKIIPLKFNFLKINGITLIHIMVYLGEIFGCFIGFFSLSFKDNNDYIIKIFQLNILFYTIFVLCLEFFFLSFKDLLKEKPIRRIIYKRNERKVQRMEF